MVTSSVGMLMTSSVDVRVTVHEAEGEGVPHQRGGHDERVEHLVALQLNIS